MPRSLVSLRQKMSWPLGRIVTALALLGSSLALLVAPGASTPARAAPLVYNASLTGPGEEPPNASPGTGTARVELDLATHTLRVQVSFSGLLAHTTASHIHACTASPGTGTAGIATQTPTFGDFPLGTTSGSYDRTFATLDLATYNPAFVTANGGSAAGAEAALAACLAAGRAYLNVHSVMFPGGEIRGFLTLVPQGATISVHFGLRGDPVDPPPPLGGATRDRVQPPVLVIRSGDTVNFLNLGQPHQVAIYDKNLTKNGTSVPTTLADINATAGTGTFLDDPVGRLALGAPGQTINFTFTNTTGEVEQYLVICAFRPHFVDSAMSTVILVTP